MAAGSAATAVGVMCPAPLPGTAPRPAGMLTPNIGRPKSVASSSAFSWMPRMSGVVREVRPLRTRQRLADRDGVRRAGAQLLGEVAVQPLAVLEEVGVAVLVARAGDEHRPLLGERLGPVERQRHAGEGVAVDEVVARVAAGAE